MMHQPPSLFLVAVPFVWVLHSHQEHHCLWDIAGIVGGIVVGILSGSQLGVSGPAAGLAVIVLHALGFGLEIFLAVVIGGVIQLVLGFQRRIS